MRTVLSCLCLLLLSAFSHAEDFVRLKDGNLQTAIATYEKDGVEVDLVAAVHIGDLAYYRDLNKRMRKYDALLYELVAPKNTIPDRKKKGLNLGKMLLGLESQTEQINYDRKNFVHADMTPDDIKAMWKSRGEDPVIFGLRVVADMMQSNNLLKAMGAKPNQPNISDQAELKKSMAKQLTSGINTTGSKTLDKLLITDRNGKCMEVFDEQVKAGKKKLGIFYGAAHLKDFDKRLTDLGYKQTKVEWVTAWDMEDD